MHYGVCSSLLEVRSEKEASMRPTQLSVNYTEKENMQFKCEGFHKKERKKERKKGKKEEMREGRKKENREREGESKTKRK